MFYAEAVKDVGGWITNRIVDGVTKVAGVASEIGGWIKNRVGEIFGFVKEGAEGVGKSIMGAIVSGLTGAAGLARQAANTVIRAINDAIPNSIDLPKPLGSINLPDNPIPMLATGARNFRGGLAMVGERGPELVQLPRGANVYTASETRAMSAGPGGTAGGVIINHYGDQIVHDRFDEQVFAADLAWRVMTA